VKGGSRNNNKSSGDTIRDKFNKRKRNKNITVTLVELKLWGR